jgi:Major Facilitator Superfamily
MTVSAERLQQANALRGLASSIGFIAGPALAGLLVATVGPGWALGVDAATFGVSALFLARLRLPAYERLPTQPFVRELLKGWREFRSRTWLWVIVLAAGVANMMSGPFFVLGAAISRESLGGAAAWALILTALNVGAFAGGLLALRLRPRRPLVAAFVGFLPFGVPSALLALGAPAIMVAAGALLAGGGLLFGNALWETTLQQQIPPRALSRVTAYDWFGSTLFQPLGNALVGPLAGAIGNGATLWLAAATILTVNLTVLALPSVRAIEARRPQLDAAAESATAEIA